MSNSVDLVGKLARAAAHTGADPLPDHVRQRLLDVVLDVIASSSAGSIEPDVIRLAHHHVLPDGPCVVLSGGSTPDAGVAAYLNASGTAYHQLQDGHRLARGHPGSHVVPALLAVAQQEGATAEAFLRAVLAGYEVGVRVGRAMGGTAPGIHDIGTWGTIAAAAGAAHLMSGADPDVISRAIDGASLIASLGSSSTVFSGYSGQHVLLASAVQAGIYAARSAMAGLMAKPGTLVDHFLRVSAAHPTPQELVTGIDADDLWTHHEVLGGYLKVHATCAHLHGVNDAVADIVAEHHPVTTAITGIEVRIPTTGVELGNADPHNTLEARFSLAASVAVGLQAGALDESSFDATQLADPEIRRLAKVTKVAQDGALNSRPGRPSIVDVHLSNGTTLTATSDIPRGDSTRALTPQEVDDKALRLLRRRYPSTATDILQAIRHLGMGGSIEAVSARLAVAPY